MGTIQSDARSLLRAAPIALEFLTPLRFRPVQQWDDRTFGQSLGWYPAVGLLLGLILLLLDRLLEEFLPVGPASALLLAALALFLVSLLPWPLRGAARDPAAEASR